MVRRRLERLALMQRPPNLASLVGDSATRIRRAFHEYHGEVDKSVGELELTLASTRLIRLGVGRGGEALAVSSEPLRDAFDGPLSAENAAYVSESGKWTIFDLSDSPDYREVIGTPITDAAPIESPRGILVGVILQTSTRSMTVQVEFDDLIVTVA
jgi:hypothetical protein